MWWVTAWLVQCLHALPQLSSLVYQRWMSVLHASTTSHAITTSCPHHVMPSHVMQPPRHVITMSRHHVMPPPRHATTTSCHHHVMPPPRHAATPLLSNHFTINFSHHAHQTEGASCNFLLGKKAEIKRVCNEGHSV